MKKITIEIKKFAEIPRAELADMNKYRIKEYGRNSDLINKNDDGSAVFFIVKNDREIKSFGMMKPVKIKYLGKEYNILGMGRGLAVEKGKEYGRILNAGRIHYIKKSGKTVLAFTSRKNKVFFEKAGFGYSNNFIRRFRYVNPKTGEMVLDDEGDGVYYEGRDKLISKMLSTKGIAYMRVPFW